MCNIIKDLNYYYHYNYPNLYVQYKDQMYFTMGYYSPQTGTCWVTSDTKPEMLYKIENPSLDILIGKIPLKWIEDLITYYIDKDSHEM